MPNYGGQWVWNDETEECVARLFERGPRHRIAVDRIKSAKWFARRAMAILGLRGNRDMVAAAIAHRLMRS